MLRCPRKLFFFLPVLFMSFSTLGKSLENYEYDATGNIVSIKQSDQSLAIYSFSPASGPVGAIVTIHGNLFSDVPEQNAVSFNGTPASILSATESALIVRVPQGATTGLVSVTVQGNTAYSGNDFMVTEDGGGPVIYDFLPKCGAAGTTVTVRGDGFDPAPAATQAGIGDLFTDANVVNPGELVFALPNKAVTGHVRAITAGGMANSKEHFFVPPSGSGITCANLGRGLIPIAIEQSKTIAIASGNRAILVFDAQAGDLLSFHLSNIVKNPSNSSLSYSLYDAKGTLWKSGSITEQTATILPPLIPASGTYVLSLQVSNNGSADLSVRLTRNPVIVANAAPLSLETETPGQTLRFGILAEQGQWLGIGFENLAITPSNNSITVYIYKPDGTSLINCNISGTAGSCILPMLPTSGMYQLVIQPRSNVAASFDLLLTEDASGMLEANETAQTFTPTRVGQAVSYTFTGTAGQNANLQISGNTFFGYAYVYVYKPDGTQLIYTTALGSSLGASSNLALNNLPATGTYTVRLIPPSGQLGSVHIALRTEITGELALGATASAVTLLAGQNASYTFTGTEGQRLGVGFENLAITPSNNNITVYIYKPDGTSLINCNISGTAGSCTPPSLPISGAYRLVVRPGNNVVASFDLLLTEDASGILEANGTAQTFTPTRVGQAMSYTFTGTAGQNANLQISGNTFFGYAYVYVYKPDGTQLIYTTALGSSLGASSNLALNNLPATGTYTVRLIPPSGQLGNLTIKLQ